MLLGIPRSSSCIFLRNSSQTVIIPSVRRPESCSWNTHNSSLCYSSHHYRCHTEVRVADNCSESCWRCIRNDFFCSCRILVVCRSFLFLFPFHSLLFFVSSSRQHYFDPGICTSRIRRSRMTVANGTCFCHSGRSCPGCSWRGRTCRVGISVGASSRRALWWRGRSLLVCIFKQRSWWSVESQRPVKPSYSWTF